MSPEDTIDAIVLVHPAYAPSRTHEYADALRKVTEQAANSGTPILAVPYGGKGWTEYAWKNFSDFSKQWITLPHEMYESEVECVDLISSCIDRPIQWANLLFGGAYAEACVASLAQRMCREFEGPRMHHEKSADIAARKGKVMGEISLPFLR